MFRQEHRHCVLGQADGILVHSWRFSIADKCCLCPWISQRKLFSSFGRYSSFTSKRDQLNEQGWALNCSVSGAFDANLPPGSFARLALWNSTSGIYLWKSIFNFGRLQVGFVTLFAAWMLVYVVWSIPIMMTLPSSSSPLTKLGKSTSAANSSASLFSGTVGSDALRWTCVTYRASSACCIYCRLHGHLLGWFQYSAWHRVFRCRLTQLFSWEHAQHFLWQRGEEDYLLWPLRRRRNRVLF